MSKFYYHALPANAEIPKYKNHAKELVVVWSLLKFLESKGFVPYLVNDGEEKVKVRNAEHAFEIIVSVEDAYLYVLDSNGKKYWVRFVFGNEWYELLADWSYNERADFGSIMDEVINYLDPSGAPCIPRKAKAKGEAA